MTAHPEVERIAALVEENIALRCLLGGGCDANNDGLHTAMKHPRGEEFCTECGETLRNGKSRPWFNEARLERTLARLRLESAILQERR